MLPKSPRKAVNILKHLWDQIYKSSPRKRTLMDAMWSKDKKIGKYMYLVGKYRKGKNQFQLGSTVKNMQKHFTSLRSACRHTNMHWSQFHSCTKMHQKSELKLKYKRKLGAGDI